MLSSHMCVQKVGIKSNYNSRRDSDQRGAVGVDMAAAVAAVICVSGCGREQSSDCVNGQRGR
jgi:hypothetical protein